MTFWKSEPRKIYIPKVLEKGGLLSSFGGSPAAVQYRVWAKTIDGKDILLADPEFQGILIAWRRLQQNLEYYIDIKLPVAVVWDKGLGAYREVDLDTMMPWVKLEPDIRKSGKLKEILEERRRKEEEETAERQKKEILAQADLVGSKEYAPPTEEQMKKYGGKKKAKAKKNPDVQEGKLISLWRTRGGRYVIELREWPDKKGYYINYFKSGKYTGGGNGYNLVQAADRIRQEINGAAEIDGIYYHQVPVRNPRYRRFHY